MKNKLIDLNNHLFECVERLMTADDDLEKLETEIDRANAVAKVAEVVVKNGELAFKAYVYASEAGMQPEMPKLLVGE